MKASMLLQGTFPANTDNSMIFLGSKSISAVRSVLIPISSRIYSRLIVPKDFLALSRLTLIYFI